MIAIRCAHPQVMSLIHPSRQPLSGRLMLGVSGLAVFLLVLEWLVLRAWVPIVVCVFYAVARWGASPRVEPR